MEFLIAVMTSYTTQRTKLFYLGEDMNIDELKNEIRADLNDGETVDFYLGFNDRRAEDDGYVEIRMEETE